MKPDFLPSPGLIPTGHQLRVAVTKACSYVEIVAALKGGKTEQAKSLDSFFVAARASLTAFIDAVVPTFTSAKVSLAAPTKLVITYSEGLNPDIVPAVSAFVSAPARVFSSVEIDGNKVTLTSTLPYTAGATTVTYTAPAVNKLQDTSGNLLATHGPSTVTVA